MPVKKQSLLQALEELKHVLADDAAGQGEDWSRRMSQALATLEQFLRQHRATLSDAEGRVVDLDTSTNPSPGVARRADKLHQELDKLLGEAQTLREKLKAVHPSGGVETPSTDAGALPVAPEVGDRTDFSVFCEQVEELLKELEHYNEEEVRLIEDNITLDLGAGD
jgi:hypothetical protein